MEPNLFTSKSITMFNWFDKNFWGAEISAAASWASFAFLEGAAQLITAFAAAIAAVIFVIRGVYDMKTKRLEYREAEKKSNSKTDIS